ncbi:helix-turn-helix transcriptional regulator [Rhizobacter fulvus]
MLAHVSVGRTKWRELVNDGDAPAPIRLSERVSLYDATAIRRWIAERAAGTPLTSMSTTAKASVAGADHPA